LDNIVYQDIAENEALTSVFFLAGIRGNNKIFVFDTDNDKIFTGEKIYEFDNNTNEINPFVEIKNVPFFTGNQKFSMSLFVRPVTIKLRIPNSKNKSNIGITAIPIFRYGEFKSLDGEIYKLAMFNQFYTEYTKKNSFLVIVPYANQFPRASSFPVKYRPGDTIYLNKQIYLFKNVSVSGDSISLEHLGELDKNFGIAEGYYAFRQKFNNIQDGKSYEIGTSKKYTLIDFWGTWCVPCLELTDELKRMQEDYGKEKFQIVSIAYDDNEQTVLNYLIKKDINWINGYDDMKNSIFCSKFKVNDFPTFILLDKEGKIIKRGVGKDALEEIIKILKSVE
jgi:thiol-disulfide isomerase/thioredoxin